MDSVKEWQQKTEEKFLQEEELKEEKNLQSATSTQEDNKSFFTGNKLPKELIIRGHNAFADIFESSDRYSAGLLRANVKANKGENEKNFNSPTFSVKAGFVVTKKRIRSSVNRNRIKRLLRESFRQEKTIIPASSVKKEFEIIFSLSDSGYEKFLSAGLHLNEISTSMNKLLTKIFKIST